MFKPILQQGMREMKMSSQFVREHSATRALYNSIEIPKGISDEPVSIAGWA